MKRREFVGTVGSAVAGMVILNGMPVKALATGSLLEALAATGSDTSDHVLVVINLVNPFI